MPSPICLRPYVGAEVSMAGSYSRDLRGRVLAAVEAGTSPEAAARRFAVGRSTAYRWAAAARAEGRREAKRMGGGPAPRIRGEIEAAMRSEEHTSELQSRQYLVCRLLLEKKKKTHEELSRHN